MSFIKHIPCEACGSSDARSVWKDGHEYCFSCLDYKAGNNKENTPTPLDFKRKNLMSDIIEHYTICGLPSRKISEKTCTKFQYGIAPHPRNKNESVHIAPYFDKFGRLISQKCRTKDKEFFWCGNHQESKRLFGQHLWKKGQKSIIITEGEIDALSCSQILGPSWPVVSLRNGAASAHKELSQNLEYLESFDEIILCFDQDEAGQKAIESVVDLFQPGKIKIASLELKDPNEMLVNEKYNELKTAIIEASEYTPQGFVDASELLDDLLNFNITQDAPYPFPMLNKKTFGLRKGELVTITAGTGTGKSTFIQNLVHQLLSSNKDTKIGYLALEENIKKTALSILSFQAKKPLHMSKDPLTKQELAQPFEQLFSKDKLHLFDHFGSCQSSTLLNKIRYLVKAKKCEWIFLDHIAMVLSGDESGDERRKIDALMTKLRCLVEELRCGMLVVSHLKRKNNSDKETHEEGSQVSLSDLRGSQAIAQISDIVISLVRNQQAADPNERNTVKINVLKNRFTGETGPCDHIQFNKIPGKYGFEVVNTIASKTIPKASKSPNKDF